MRKRKQSSGGQAIVLVSLALFSMAGMMGLAVDLGWSFFSQKAAQAAADDAALSAVQRAYKAITAGGAVATVATCATAGMTCQPTATTCDPANASLGNLQSGCLYARNDGFVPGGHGGRQNVLIQSNTPPTFPDSIPDPPGPPQDMVYWVTVRTYEAIPQLFSSFMGNTQGSISAVATAAIASKIIPGSFWGMNKRYDCRFRGGTALLGFTFTGCGIDIDIQSPAAGDNVACTGGGGQQAFLCAPSGIILSSACANNGLAGCGNSSPTGTGSNYGGNSGKVWGGPAINIVASNAANGLTAVPTPKVAGNAVDPFQNKPQPPLASGTSAPISSCGYPGGVIPATTSHLGPFQYYSYTTVTVGGAQVKIPDAQPIQLPSNPTFDPTASGAAGCPGGIFTQGSNTQSANSSFPTYIFYGGINTGQNGVGTVTMGAGQYVFAGNNGNNSVANGSSDNVFASKNTIWNGTSGAGQMLILTDGKYPGLSSQLPGIPNSVCTVATCGVGNFSKIDPAQIDPSTGENWLIQGSVQNKNSDITLNGWDKNATAQSLPQLDPYTGILVWQDRRNSTVIYDSIGNVIKCYDPACASSPTQADYESNNVTADSPGLALTDGQGALTLKGAIVQPRGAWYIINPGVSGVHNSPLQIFTGQLIGGGALLMWSCWDQRTALSLICRC